MVRRRSHPDGDEVAVRGRQQAAVAELGQRALAGASLDELIEAAAEQAARELDGDYVSVLELTGDRRGMLVRGGYGFPEGVLGGVLPAGRDDLPGYALHSEGPVLIDDFATEKRFGPSPLQRDLDVVSALAASIGSRGRQFGVIAAHSQAPGHFDPEDANFLQSVANVLGAAAERARHEEMVSDSEARFRELADTTPALMWMTDAEGHVTYVNAAWQRFTGRSLSEELGNTFAMRAHDEDRAQLLEAWRAELARRSEFRFEYRLVHHRGGHRWVLDVGSPRFAEGEFAGYVGTATDIDERKRMEAALSESEGKLRDLTDTAPVMMWTTDERGLVTFVNPGWLRFTGTTLEEELGLMKASGVHPDDSHTVMASWNEHLARREPWESEYRLRGRGGKHRWILDRGVPRYSGDRFVGYVGAAIDIHERRTVEGPPARGA
jgi:PAS domain S-box-containing protein